MPRPTNLTGMSSSRSMATMMPPLAVPSSLERKIPVTSVTSWKERAWARKNANVLLTNPEMLHYGLLPNHAKWATFLRRLEYVVIDELHVLRGIFGTHVAHVVRRLRRACSRYGGDPTFVFCSATIGEPDRLASEICAKPVVAVTDDGSPCAERRVAIVQPAEVDPDRGIRQSPATEAIRAIAELVGAVHRVIAFCMSRAQTERVALGVAKALPPELAATVRPYRSGYLASERREIEEELASGALRAVVATRAVRWSTSFSRLPPRWRHSTAARSPASSSDRIRLVFSSAFR